MRAITLFTDENGTEFRAQPNGTGSFNIVIFRDGIERATPVRFKAASGNKVAADFPGCDPNYVLTDANGRITI